MDSEETKIYDLEKKLVFSRKADLPILFFLTLCMCLIPDIVNLYPPWLSSLKKIIEQVYSDKVFSIFTYIIIFLFIILSSIWPFLRRYWICLKIIKLREKQLEKSRSEHKQLQLQKPIIINRNIITNNIYNTHTPDKPSDLVYFKPTPGKPSGPKTKNYTGHTTPIDSDKIGILDIANDTANPHNEDHK